MRIQELMSEHVETVSPEAPATSARELMGRRRIRHLVVVSSGRVVGVVSDRDLQRIRSPFQGAPALVRDLMSPSVVTATPETTVKRAANLLRGYSVGCLPVLIGSRLAGIVTVSDVLELIGRGLERPVAKTKRWTLKHRGARRPALAPMTRR